MGVSDRYEINSEVPITIAKRPPLEHSHRVSLFRGHSQFQDRGSIVDSLRHGARPPQQDTEASYLQAPEFRLGNICTACSVALPCIPCCPIHLRMKEMRQTRHL